MNVRVLKLRHDSIVFRCLDISDYHRNQTILDILVRSMNGVPSFFQMS